MKWMAFAVLAGATAVGWQGSEVCEIRVDPQAPGRVFDGIGAVSAGASSRLLIDYPEPQRSQILDYLFTPGYGASLQHLKVEIGGDANSTDGSEPSHMRARDDFNPRRGYEWWLMKEARRRNPKILLDTLAWAAPGWIGGGEYFSQDMADYVVKYLQAARDVHGLEIQFTGIWNEKNENAEWVKLLRRTLDANGFKKTLIVAPDRADKEQYDIIHRLRKDPELDAAIHAVTVHYPRILTKGVAPQWAKESGKRMWASEEQPALGDGPAGPLIGSREWEPGGKSLAQVYNTNYIEGRLTKAEIWSPVTSYYDILAAPNSGLMYANTPWSGNYDVQPTIWVTAHTTQFAQPGWRYVDSACGYLPGKGSYVTLVPPDASEYSVVVETIDASNAQTVLLRVPEALVSKPAHVWMTDGKALLEKVQTLRPSNGAVEVRVGPGAIYTVSTTTGQGKGKAAPPAAKRFPFPYGEDFENVANGRTPKYMADQNGAFEAMPCTRRGGQCVAQAVNRRPISWGLNADPYTLLGDPAWTDYEVSVEARLQEEGHLLVMGRIDSANYFAEWKTRWPAGYVLTVQSGGSWALANKVLKKPPVELASGKTQMAVGEWHLLTLRFRGATITALLDGKPLAEVTDATHARGMVGFGTGWNLAEFDNLRIR